MNKELLKEITDKLDKLLHNGIFTGKYVVLFGMNHPGDFVIDYCLKKNVRVGAIADNNPLNTGKQMMGVTVSLPIECLEPFNDSALILICSKYYPEMRSQAQTMGYSGKHIYKLADMGAPSSSGIGEAAFKSAKAAVLNGFDFYRKIKRQYGEDTHVFISPVRANGDVYMACSYLGSYIKKNGISDYVLVSVGASCSKTADMFGINNMAASQKDIEALSAFAGFADISRLKFVQPFYPHTNFLHNFDCYKGINVLDYYKYCVFGLENEMSAPRVYRDNGYVHGFFELNGLKKGKTAILFPYANSLPRIDMELFVIIAEMLKKEGYTVATNSADETEPAVYGTESVFFPLEHVIPIMEHAGYYLGVRNGMCELLSRANCKKVIIYPDKAYGFGKAVELYGLGEISSHAYEFEYSQNHEELARLIINRIKQDKTG